MARKRKYKKEIYPQYWYVADMLAFPDVHIFSQSFFTQQDAHNAIDRGLDGNHQRFDTIKGSLAIELGILNWGNDYRVLKPRDWINKYNYGAPPKGHNDPQRRARWWKRGIRRNARNRRKVNALKQYRNESSKIQSQGISDQSGQ